MTDKDLRPHTSAVSAINIAGIETLMLLKEVGADRLQLILDRKGVQKLEDLEWLTIRNFLDCLRSL